MSEGLAHTAVYGNGEGNTTKHYYAGRPDTAKAKKKKKCKSKRGKK